MQQVFLELSDAVLYGVFVFRVHLLGIKSRGKPPAPYFGVYIQVKKVNEGYSSKWMSLVQRRSHSEKSYNRKILTRSDVVCCLQ